MRRSELRFVIWQHIIYIRFNIYYLIFYSYIFIFNSIYSRRIQYDWKHLNVKTKWFKNGMFIVIHHIVQWCIYHSQISSNAFKIIRFASHQYNTTNGLIERWIVAEMNWTKCLLVSENRFNKHQTYYFYRLCKPSPNDNSKRNSNTTCSK